MVGVSDPDAGRCSATAASTGERCRQPATEGDVCAYHTDDAPAEPGAPEGNTNAMSHGAHTSRERALEGFDADDEEFVDDVAESLTDAVRAERGGVNAAEAFLIHSCAADIAIYYRLAADVKATGATREKPHHKPNGEIYYEEVANFNVGESRRLRTSIANELDRLGLFDGEGEDVGETLVELLSGA